jgi:site-specific recombinase XerD
MSKKQQRKCVSRSTTLTIPELEQSKAAVLNTVASAHSQRSYKYTIERFIVWYCDEPRLAFNRSVVMRYRSFLESLSLSAATINLHLSAIRRLADESAESGWLSPELVTGIRRVKGVKRLGRKIGNWLTGTQAQKLLNAVSQNTLRGRRDGAMLGLLLGCGLRRSEVVGLRLDQPQLRESHWAIVELEGKGGRIRTVPVPNWCKELVDVWLRHLGVNDGKVFRRVLKNGARQGAGVTANVVWYAVKRCAKQAGIGTSAVGANRSRAAEPVEASQCAGAVAPDGDPCTSGTGERANCPGECRTRIGEVLRRADGQVWHATIQSGDG